MINKINSLKKRDFKKIYQGKNILGKSVFLRFRINNTNKLKISIVIGTKFSLKATERNRHKRRIREIIRKLLPKLKKGYDIVFYPSSKVKELKFQDIEKEIIYLLKKAKLYD